MGGLVMRDIYFFFLILCVIEVFFFVVVGVLGFVSYVFFDLICCCDVLCEFFFCFGKGFMG